MTDSPTDRLWCPEGWRRDIFEHDGRTHVFYEAEHEKHPPSRPAVLLLHELPGIDRHLERLANTLSADFRVFVPSILGRDGDPGFIGSAREVCVRREVHMFGSGAASRSTGWLKAFAAQHLAPQGRYGVIGMCFSGGYALALAVDEAVAAAVVAQHAAPLFPVGGLGLSQDDRDALEEHPDLRVRAYRFGCDAMAPASKAAAAKKLLKDRIVVTTLAKPRWRSHSTLTGPDASDRAIAEVREFLAERLGDGPA
ncbi:dienelactone hydrolase family protein [Microbacterium thalassium]|uniref:Dienelactone hydrolase n=1 Tax=Microbacterium thalassium TaxID=362649 RepID=A0A7X0KUE1_9MICO|nr:dienelactone hydrolase family protein [Microbacterium thalassium]MBB6391081.1 dienelactone hydrolase [Microbacterium thalassium]GLK23808.1 dienelactone hydrolase [Microbacterium thalassium]